MPGPVSDPYRRPPMGGPEMVRIEGEIPIDDVERIIAGEGIPESVLRLFPSAEVGRILVGGGDRAGAGEARDLQARETGLPARIWSRKLV